MKSRSRRAATTAFATRAIAIVATAAFAIACVAKPTTAPNATAPNEAMPKAMMPNAIHLEAEDAQLTGVTVVSTRAGFSGWGYVSGFDQDGDKIAWSVSNARAGLYQVSVRYAAPWGEKGLDLVVNGAKTSLMLAKTEDAFASQSGVKVELKAGANTIAVEKGWGYYDIDAIDLIPARIDLSLRKPPATLADPKASAGARALIRKLIDLYGAQTVSGQTEIKDAEYIKSTTGVMPAIIASDFIDYSPSRVAHGSDPKGESEKMIALAKHHIISMHWHWNAPAGLLEKDYADAQGKTVQAAWWSGFYTRSTTFDLQKALAEPDSPDYKLLLRDIDVIAAQLKKFDAAGVPILWRPLHEAEGGWFWWGAKGPDAFKSLWKLLFHRLTEYHHLHNLIWVYSSGVKPEWYPGDAFVDIVGIDQYPADWSDPTTGAWETLKARFDNRKLLALTEFGGVPDIEKMRRFGVRWSYFVSWTSDLGPRKLPPGELKRIYTSRQVLTRDEWSPAAPEAKPLASR